MLKQLPNGDWIDPTTVTSVRALELSRCVFTDTTHSNRVVVMWGKMMCSVINCESYADAERIRDEIAGWCNEPLPVIAVNLEGIDESA